MPLYELYLKRKNFRPSTASNESKQERIIDCLKSTHCPMTFRQIQQWIGANPPPVFLTNKEVVHHLGLLRAAGKVDHAVLPGNKDGPWTLK